MAFAMALLESALAPGPEPEPLQPERADAPEAARESERPTEVVRGRAPASDVEGESREACATLGSASGLAASATPMPPPRAPWPRTPWPLGLWSAAPNADGRAPSALGASPRTPATRGGCSWLWRDDRSALGAAGARDRSEQSPRSGEASAEPGRIGDDTAEAERAPAAPRRAIGGRPRGPGRGEREPTGGDAAAEEAGTVPPTAPREAGEIPGGGAATLGALGDSREALPELEDPPAAAISPLIAFKGSRALCTLPRGPRRLNPPGPSWPSEQADGGASSSRSSANGAGIAHTAPLPRGVDSASESPSWPPSPNEETADIQGPKEESRPESLPAEAARLAVVVEVSEAARPANAEEAEAAEAKDGALVEAAEAARLSGVGEVVRLAPGDELVDPASVAARANAERDDASNGVSRTSKRTPADPERDGTADDRRADASAERGRPRSRRAATNAERIAEAGTAGDASFAGVGKTSESEKEAGGGAGAGVASRVAGVAPESTRAAAGGRVVGAFAFVGAFAGA